MLICSRYGGRRRRLVTAGLSLLAALAIAPAANAADAQLAGTNVVGSIGSEAVPGAAEVYKTTAAATGVATSISVHLAWNSNSTAMEFGIYADEGGRPTTLLTSGRSEAPIAGAWNTIDVPAAEIQAGKTYWIGLLNPATSEGALRWHDRAGDASGAEQSGASVNLTTLPDQWVTGIFYNDGPLSGYISGVATPTEPELAVTPSQLTFFSTVGSNPVPKSLAVSDLAGGALDYAATETSSWLDVAPAHGTTPADLNVYVDTSALSPGTYEAEIRIDAPGAEGSPRIVPVSLTVNSPRTDNGLVGAWAFNEASGDLTKDFSNFTNNGTLSGPARVPGRFGNALSFDGQDDWVTVQDANSLDFTTAMTLEAWVKPTDPGSAWRTVVLKEQDGQLVYGLYANTDSGLPAGHVFTDGDSGLTGPTPLPLDEWTHIATTWDGSTLRLFVDAAEVASMPLPGPAVTSAHPLRIGGNGVWGEWFKGLIDEVRVYDRALSANELAADRDTAIDPVTDTIAPTTAATTAPEANTAGWLRGQGTVKIVASDETDGSGIRQIAYSASGAQATAPKVVAGGTVEIPVTAEGVTEFRYKATDNAGNTEAERVITVKIDSSAPAVTCASPDGEWHGANVSLVCSSLEEGSGLSSTDDAVFSLSTSVPAGQETANAATGTRRVCDLAGNCTDVAAITGIKVDRKGPTLKVPANMTVEASSPTGKAVSYSATATDGVDPAPVVTCLPASGAMMGIGTTTVNCTAKDAAGNASTGSFTVKMLGAPEQIVNLTNDTLAMFKLKMLSLPLQAALQDAATKITQRKPSLACAALNVYLLAVKVMPTSMLSTANKALLTEDANRIRAVIGC